MNKKSILNLLDFDENAPKNTTYARWSLIMLHFLVTLKSI
jgi:hypothetical protein